ncbi:MAG: hypothetical protein A2X86_10280 [Bdellovibrionales bacterium GWA2_49_15]|nr:MAG: hypothetical protein A2X86_10280 [Bdellovibrionales bacterium GWA2_49_15]HAZ13773.1 hypothetical protein [Bdellovibrionales bacterium]
MSKMIVILFLMCACKVDIMRNEEPTQVPDQMRETINLSANDQSLAKILCEALEQKRSLFRALHDGKIFDFQLEQYNCGAKVVDSPITATLRAPIGQAMTYEASVGSQLYFGDVLTSKEGITHFLCDKIASGQLHQNTITISDVEKIQIYFGGNTNTGVILEIWDYVANAKGEHLLKEVQSIKFHVKPSTQSDLTGLEMDRAVSKKCPADGKLSNTSRQKSLESLP